MVMTNVRFHFGLTMCGDSQAGQWKCTSHIAELTGSESQVRAASALAICLFTMKRNVWTLDVV